MPLYEYKCSNCGHHFEKLESFNSLASASCPECGSSSKRLLSLGTFILKGSGWYASEHSSRDHKTTKPAETCNAKCDSCCEAGQKSA